MIDRYRASGIPHHQAVTATSRLSSSDPNLQNIPIRTEQGRRVRTAFIPDDGNKMVAIDYSQIELRIMAHLSEDPGLIRLNRDAIFTQLLHLRYLMSHWMM